MATKNVYLEDDAGNQIKPMVTSKNIGDVNGTIATLDQVFDKDHSINMNAGTIQSNDNLNFYDKTGMYNVENATNIQNAPKDDIKYSKLFVTNSSTGTNQILVKGLDIYARVYSGSPQEWSGWCRYSREGIYDDVIKNGSNLDDYKQTGIFQIYGVGEIANSPVPNSSYAQLIVLDKGVGVYQFFIQGSNICMRYYSGNPLSWVGWYIFDLKSFATMQEQIAFLAKQAGGAN